MDFRVSSSYFKVEIDGMDCSDIHFVRGLDIFSVDSERHQRNYNKTYTTEMEIHRPFTDLGFFDWITRNKTAEKAEKKNGSLSFITEKGEPIITIKLEGIFPIEWHGPKLEKARNWGSQDSLEEIVLAVERVSRAE
ncbi:MAG: phage tail protein [Spirochaetia bacterium]